MDLDDNSKFNDELIQSLKFYIPEYANKTDEEILADYDLMCVMKMLGLMNNGDERQEIVEEQ